MGHNNTNDVFKPCFFGLLESETQVSYFQLYNLVKDLMPKFVLKIIHADFC